MYSLKAEVRHGNMTEMQLLVIAHPKLCQTFDFHSILKGVGIK